MLAVSVSDDWKPGVKHSQGPFSSFSEQAKCLCCPSRLNLRPSEGAGRMQKEGKKTRLCSKVSEEELMIQAKPCRYHTIKGRILHYSAADAPHVSLSLRRLFLPLV